MPLGYAVGSIAGVDLVDANSTPCKALIIDGVNLQITAVGNSQIAASGEVYTQVFETTKGQSFGVKIEYLPPDVLNSIIAAIMAAVGAGDSFNVTLQDDIHDINTDCILDFSQKPISYPEGRTHPDVVKGLELRFITV